MGKPVFLVENLFSEIQFPGHSVEANEEQSGFEAWRVATARRHSGDYWTPTTLNQDAWVKVDCGSAVSADMIVLDRGHNLAGQTITLQGSTDDFAASNDTVVSVTIPSSTSTDGDPDDANGVVTEEGAWLKRFTSASYRYWRLHVAAVASFKPEVVGLWLGTAWQPGEYAERPWDEDARDLAWQETQTGYGWRGAGILATPRSGEVQINLSSFSAYTAGRSFRVDFEKRRPAWYVPDDEQAERTCLVVPPSGAQVGMGFDEGWGYRIARIPYIEHEPELT